MRRLEPLILLTCYLLLAACASSGGDIAVTTDVGGDRDADSAGSGTDAAEIEAPAPCTPTDWGPSGVGVRELSLVDADRDDRSLPTLVYYPSPDAPDWAACEATYDETAGLLRFGQAAFCAGWDLPPAADGAPYPVLLYSHGSGAQKEAQSFILEHLASHGYLVVVPDHTGNVGPLRAFPDDEDMTITRAQDLHFVLDHVLASIDAPGTGEAWLAGLGDPARVGVAGHSWGGHSAAAAAGLRYSFDVIEADCEAGTVPDAYYCPLLDARAYLEEEAPDPRLKALVTYAHDAGHMVSGPACVGAEGVEVPWLQLLGTRDTFIDVQEDGWDCYEASPAPACAVVLEGAGHRGFTDVGDEHGFPQARLRALIRWYTVAFLDLHLKGTSSCQEALNTGLSAWQATPPDHEAACRW
jgi:predicted dienelactone hydrolase